MPVLVAVGGFGDEMILLWLAVEILRTVMTSLKLVPAMMVLTGSPVTISTVWNEVICNDLSAHEPGPLTVMRPVRETPLEKSVSRVKAARASVSVSLTSALVVAIVSMRLKLNEEPDGIDVLQLLAWKVTDVVLKAVRVQPAGAAVEEEKSEPVPGRRKRIS